MLVSLFCVAVRRILELLILRTLKGVERGERDGSLIGASDRSAFSLWRTRLRGQPRSVLFIAASSPPLLDLLEMQVDPQEDEGPQQHAEDC